MKRLFLLFGISAWIGIVSLNAADLDLRGEDRTLSNFSGVDNITNSGGATTLTVNPTSEAIFGGKITGSNGKITVLKTGSETWTVTSDLSNVWTNLEKLEIQEGTIKMANQGNLNGRFITCLITVTGENSVLELAVYNPLGFSGNAMTLNLENGGTLHLSGDVMDIYRGQQLRGFAVSLNNGHITVTSAQPGEMEQLLYTSNGVTIQSQGISDIAAAFDMRGTLTTAVSNGTLTLNGRLQDLTHTNSPLVKTGAGTLILGNSGNNYSGETRVLGGTLQLGGANAILQSSRVILQDSTIDLAGFDQTLNNGSGTANGKVVNSSVDSVTLTVAITNPSEVFSGQIQGNATGKINLVKTGSGVWNVATDAAVNPWQNLEKVTVSEGTLKLSKSHAGTTHRLIVGEINVLKDAVLDLAAENTLANNYSSANSLTITLQGGTMTSSNQATQLLRNTDFVLQDGVISNMLFYFASDPGTYDMTLRSSGNSEISATTVFRGDTAWNVTSGVLTCSGVLRQDFTGNPTLTKSGAGRIDITNRDNTTTATLNIAEGGLFLNGGKWNSDVNLAEGTTFSAAENAVISGKLTLDGDYQIDLLRDFSESVTLTAQEFSSGESASMTLFYDGVLLSEMEFPAQKLAEMEPFPLLRVTDNAEEAFLSLSRLLAQNTFANDYLNLSSSENTFWLSVDRNRIPEPTTWSLILLASLWIGSMAKNKMKRRNCL